jgi:hypothetical protein
MEPVRQRYQPMAQVWVDHCAIVNNFRKVSERNVLKFWNNPVLGGSRPVQVVRHLPGVARPPSESDQSEAGRCNGLASVHPATVLAPLNRRGGRLKGHGAGVPARYAVVEVGPKYFGCPTL